MPDVRIISDFKTVRYVAANEPVVMRAITYIYGDRPPRAIEIPDSEYSEAERARRIREDIQKAGEAGPNIITV